MAKRDNDGGVVNLFAGLSRPAAFDASKLAETFRRRPEATWSIPEAYLAVLVTAATADGSVGDEERQMLMWVCRRSRVLAHLSIDALSEANEAVNRRLRAEPDALQDACDSLPSDLVPPVFAHACLVVLADGQLADDETRFLQALVPALKLEEREASRLLEAMLIAAS